MALFGLCVLVIVAAEFTARVVLLIDDSFFDPTYARSSILPSVPDGYDAAQLLLDMDAETRDPIAYQPYTLWTHRPFAGTLLRIDERGNRVTLNNSQRDDALQLWMFGGSTMRSGSVPDGETIPSHLSRILNQEWGLDAQVSNYGESGFVSTQEVNSSHPRTAKLAGRPDVVIFYDGANDAFAASRFPEVVGAHHGLDNIKGQTGGQGEVCLGRGAIRG